VLVDLGLQLQLELTDGPVRARAADRVDEVRHAFDREQEVTEVVIAQAARRIVLVEVRDHRRLDIEREVHLAVLFDDEELFARTPISDQLVAILRADDEVTDGETGVDAVLRFEPALHPAECSHYWITLLTSTISPAALSFFSTHSS